MTRRLCTITSAALSRTRTAYLRCILASAHLSNRPFGKQGFWGRPWRSHREFVGRMSYGVRWKMWQPAAHLAFPLGFRTAVLTMIMASRRPESLMYLLQDEIVFFIMNKCSWDWWGTKMPDDDEAEWEEEDPEAGSGSRSGAAVDGGMGTLYASLLGLGGSASNYAYYGGMFAEGAPTRTRTTRTTLSGSKSPTTTRMETALARRKRRRRRKPWIERFR